MDPMDADDRLKSVEKKLHVVQCNNREKVLLVSHQLSGPAANWWDAYVQAHEEPESINWLEFRATFCAHHVPQGFLSWTCVLSCSAVVSAKAAGSWTRVLYPAASSDSVPQQPLDSCC
jgi:hypothetical protein